MNLSTRDAPYLVPSYSLTGDLLSYLTCGLQYRYQNRGALPPSKPVQLWFGQFIHGVLEESYRQWDAGLKAFPWADDELSPIVDLVIRRLAAQGIRFQRYRLLAFAVERAFRAINELGPAIFPLITEAEVRLRGIRPLPRGSVGRRRSDYYEVSGIVDVLTSLRLVDAGDGNSVSSAILSAIEPESFEVIVDYKGMRRPRASGTGSEAWEHHSWQVQTYAWLRRQQRSSGSPRAGALLYLNELAPSVEDMSALYEEVFGGGPENTDVPPKDDDRRALEGWRKVKGQWGRALDSWQDQVRNWWREGRTNGTSFPRLPSLPSELSPGYRLERALRIIRVTEETVTESTGRFDEVVSEIEASVAREVSGTRIPRAWGATPRESTCTVCDFRKFCPAKGNKFRGTPRAP